MMSVRKQKLRTVFEKSYKTISAACSDPIIQNMGKVNVPIGRFASDPQSGMLMCRMAKHGSTTWDEYFVTLNRNG